MYQMNVQPIDRLTLQRNAQLQKQLEIKLQIIGEEYRLIQQEQMKHVEDLHQFYICLKHTAPGIRDYNQPNTKAMSIKNPTLIRKTAQSNSSRDTRRCKPGYETYGNSLSETLHQANDETKRPLSAFETYTRNPFFNKKIAVDARRKSFLTKDRIKTSPMARSTKPQNGVQTNALACLPLFHWAKAKKPGYGKDAFSDTEIKIRNVVLSQFSNIFTTRENKETQTVPRRMTLTYGPQRGYKNSVKFSFQSADINNERKVNSQKVQINVPPNGQKGERFSNYSKDTILNTAAAEERESHNILDRRYSPTLSRARGHHDISLSEQWSVHHKHRPLTAPASYELRQRVAVTPRQQLAGILSEIEERRAAIRAMLTKSQHLRHTVRTLTLVPMEMKDDWSD